MLCLWIATLWLVFPANRIVCWALRIFCWALLGPWMKVADRRYFRPWYKTKEEILRELDLNKGAEPSIELPDFNAFLESDAFVKMGQYGRVLAEDALKLKDMRELLYGTYGEVIPAVDASRYPSIPMPESYAYLTECTEPTTNPSLSSRSTCGTESFVSAVEQQHIPGQRLHGSMVMVLEDYHLKKKSRVEAEAAAASSEPSSSSFEPPPSLPDAVRHPHT